MSKISREEAVRIATGALPPQYQHCYELLGVNHATTEQCLHKLPAICDEIGLSSTDTADLLTNFAAHPIKPAWSVGLFIHSNDFRGGIALAQVTVDEATGATTMNLDATKRKLHAGTDEGASHSV